VDREKLREMQALRAFAMRLTGRLFGKAVCVTRQDAFVDPFVYSTDLFVERFFRIGLFLSAFF
jgi:hypothetical protein